MCHILNRIPFCLARCDYLKYIEKAKHCVYGDNTKENFNRNNHEGIQIIQYNDGSYQVRRCLYVKPK